MVTVRSRTALVLALIATCLPSCGLGGLWLAHPRRGPAPETIDGPEDPTLLAGVTGTLALVQYEDRRVLELVSLPGIERRSQPLEKDPLWVTGPDREGRVVYMGRTWDDGGRWWVHVVSLASGMETALVERDGEIHPTSAIALAPTGGRLALLTARHHGAYQYGPWRLELIDVGTGSSTLIEGWIEQHKPLWSPDGRLLLYVEGRIADGAAVTSRYDVERCMRTSTDEPIYASVSLSDSSLLLGCHAAWLSRVDFATREVIETGLRLPGHRTGLLVDIGDGRVLYEALMTTGQPNLHAGEYLWKWTVKICDARSGEFATVVPGVWGEVSYGEFRFTDMRSKVSDSTAGG